MWPRLRINIAHIMAHIAIRARIIITTKAATITCSIVNILILLLILIRLIIGKVPNIVIVFS